MLAKCQAGFISYFHIIAFGMDRRAEVAKNVGYESIVALE